MSQHGFNLNEVYIKYEKESGKLRMAGGSWSINLNEIDFDKTKRVIFVTKEAKYTILLEDALAVGFVKKFAGEPKLVVPLKHWQRYSHENTPRKT